MKYSSQRWRNLINTPFSDTWQAQVHDWYAVAALVSGCRLTIQHIYNLIEIILIRGDNLNVFLNKIMWWDICVHMLEGINHSRVWLTKRFLPTVEHWICVTYNIVFFFHTTLLKLFRTLGWTTCHLVFSQTREEVDQAILQRYRGNIKRTIEQIIKGLEHPFKIQYVIKCT